MPKYMLMHKTSPANEAGDPRDREMMARAGAVIRDMVKAGVLLAAEGLRPSSAGARVTPSGAGGKVTVIDGPFAETKELVAGVSIIQVRSKEEAVEWALRFAEADPDTEIDVLEVEGNG